jgi:C1A family cysteine protease
VAVYDSFPMHAGTASFARGHIPLPAPGESGPGPDGRPEGHAMLCVGYDDAHRVFLIRNSWGRAFGARGFRPGYGTIPYAYLTSTALADDFWTVRVVSGPAH